MEPNPCSIRHDLSRSAALCSVTRAFRIIYRSWLMRTTGEQESRPALPTHDVAPVTSAVDGKKPAVAAVLDEMVASTKQLDRILQELCAAKHTASGKAKANADRDEAVENQGRNDQGHGSSEATPLEHLRVNRLSICILSLVLTIAGSLWLCRLSVLSSMGLQTRRCEYPWMQRRRWTC